MQIKKALFFAALFLVASVSYADEKRYIVPLEDSPSCGSKDAAVTVIEFLDFQ